MDNIEEKTCPNCERLQAELDHAMEINREWDMVYGSGRTPGFRFSLHDLTDSTPSQSEPCERQNDP